MEIRRNFGGVVQRLQKSKEYAVIQSNGRSIAVLLPMTEYKEFLHYKRLAIFKEFTRQFGQEIEKCGLTEDELMNELEKSKNEVFAEQYGYFK